MRVHALVTLVAVTLAVGVAEAQEPSAEVTPYVAIGPAGTSPVGAAVTIPLTSTLGLETNVTYRRGEGRIHALGTDASLLWSLPRVGQATPFLAAGVGLSQYGAPLFSFDRTPVGTYSRLALRVNAGGGLKVPLNERAALRTDARWFKLVGVPGSEQFRVAQGVSLKVGKR